MQIKPQTPEIALSFMEHTKFTLHSIYLASLDFKSPSNFKLQFMKCIYFDVCKRDVVNGSIYTKIHIFMITCKSMNLTWTLGKISMRAILFSLG